MKAAQRYDIAIIGGGPAGLGAARASARLGLRTVLLERLDRPGDMGHPCSGAIAPVLGFVSGRETPDGLYFPEIDLLIPPPLVMGRPTRQRYISPSGYEIVADFPNRADFPVAIVDKAALLCLLAGQAEAAGANLRYGQAVTGLVEEKGRIVGVQTRRGIVRAALVLSAEGATRTWVEAAGLYADSPPPYGYAVVVSQELEAPAAGPADVGQLSTLGQRYGAPRRTFGTVVVPAPGHAGVYLALFTDSPHVHAEEPLWDLLERYKRDDPRVSNLLAGSRVLGRAGCRMVLRAVPPRVVRDGLAGVGDAIGPGGQAGILPSLYMGQEAARAAAAAVRAGDTSVRALKAYDRLCHGPLLRGLETEGKIMAGLAAMTDEEIDRVCQTLGRMNLAPFFFGETGPILRELARWVLTSLPQIARDWGLLRRIF